MCDHFIFHPAVQNHVLMNWRNFFFVTQADFPLNKIPLDYESYQDSTRLYVLKSVLQVVGVFSETSLRKRQPTPFSRSVHSNFSCWFNFFG